jgi:hypothetical protein
MMENNLSKEKEKSLVLPETNRWEASILAHAS